MGKGSSAAQNSIANSQKSFMDTLQQSFGKSFAGQQNIIGALNKSLTTTLNAGPSQFGFSTPEVTALNTAATQANAQAFKNARQAAGEQAAASGVSNAQLPTGAATQTEAQLAEEAAQNQSQQLLGIQEAGYKQGAENYKEAVSGLTSAASLENPAGLASTANTAGGEAASTAAQIQKENAAASPWSQVGGLVGSLAGAALNLVAPGAGTALSTVAASANPANLARTMGTQAPQLGGLGSTLAPSAPIDTSGLGDIPYTPLS